MNSTFVRRTSAEGGRHERQSRFAGKGGRHGSPGAPTAHSARQAAARAVADPVVRALVAWRSITRREVLVALAIAACSSLLGVLTSLEELRPQAALPTLLRSVALFATIPLPAVGLGLLTWILADRAPAPARRAPRMAIAVVVTAALDALLVPAALSWGLGVHDLCELLDCSEILHPPPLSVWLVSVSAGTSVLVFGGFLFSLIELRHRVRSVDDAMAVALRDRCRLQHQALATRLAALQAQVEPQFLFESLVDIQGLYAAEPSQGERTLDQLIVFLRTALPQLNDGGSTVNAQVRLAAAWLAVVAERNGGAPSFTVSVAPDCAAARMYPMLLLPLVQRAACGFKPPATALSLDINRCGEDCEARLRISGGRGGPDDPEVVRVRERLLELCGERGRLECCETTAPNATELRLTWPHERDGPPLGRLQERTA